jgi:hypothetical protein
MDGRSRSGKVVRRTSSHMSDPEASGCRSGGVVGWYLGLESGRAGKAFGGETRNRGVGVVIRRRWVKLPQDWLGLAGCPLRVFRRRVGRRARTHVGGSMWIGTARPTAARADVAEFSRSAVGDTGTVHPVTLLPWSTHGGHLLSRRMSPDVGSMGRAPRGTKSHAARPAVQGNGGVENRKTEPHPSYTSIHRARLGSHRIRFLRRHRPSVPVVRPYRSFFFLVACSGIIFPLARARIGFRRRGPTTTTGFVPSGPSHRARSNRIEAPLRASSTLQGGWCRYIRY